MISIFICIFEIVIQDEVLGFVQIWTPHREVYAYPWHIYTLPNI